MARGSGKHWAGTIVLTAVAWAAACGESTEGNENGDVAGASGEAGENSGGTSGGTRSGTRGGTTSGGVTNGGASNGGGTADGGATTAGGSENGGSTTAGGTTSGGRATGGDAGRGGGAGSAGMGARSGGTAGAGGSAVNGGSGGSASGGAGSGGAGARCRRYATEYVTSTNGTSGPPWTCGFDRLTLAISCVTGSDFVITTGYATIGDAVDDNRPIGFSRVAVYSAVFPAGTGNCTTTKIYRYDQSDRLLRIDTTVDGTCGASGTVYDAWDTLGRPTHGIETGVGTYLCVGANVALAYDDVNRVVSETRSGGTDCFIPSATWVYDADGMVISYDSGGAQATYTNLSTGEICAD